MFTTEFSLVMGASILIAIYAVITFKAIRDKLKYRVLHLIILMILMIGVVPIIIAHGIHGLSSSVGDNEAWLQFWSGYLGSIIGVLGAALFAYLNTKYQIENERNTRKLERVERVRPVITTNYRYILKDQEKIYLTSDMEDIKCSIEGISIDQTMEKLFELTGDSKIFKSQTLLDRALLSINNITKYDMYRVTVRLEYKHDVVRQNNTKTIDVVEELFIPVISAKESCIISPYLVLHDKEIFMKQIKIFYKTEEFENSLAVFSIKDPDKENANISNTAYYEYGDDIGEEIPDDSIVRSTGYTFANEKVDTALVQNRKNGDVCTDYGVGGTTTTTTTQKLN